MDMLTHGTLRQIMKQLERIANTLETKVPLNRLEKEAAIRLSETASPPGDYKLSFALADAVVNEYARASSEIERAALKNCITKYAERYFLSAQQLADEIAMLRRRKNSDFLDGMKKVRDLVAKDAEKRTVYFDGQKLGSDLLEAVDKLIEMNEPFTTEVDVNDWETA